MTLTGCLGLSLWENRWRCAFALRYMTRREWRGNNSTPGTHQWLLGWIEWLCSFIFLTGEPCWKGQQVSVIEPTLLFPLRRDGWWQWGMDEERSEYQDHPPSWGAGKHPISCTHEEDGVILCFNSTVLQHLCLDAFRCRDDPHYHHQLSRFLSHLFLHWHELEPLAALWKP